MQYKAQQAIQSYALESGRYIVAHEQGQSCERGVFISVCRFSSGDHNFLLSILPSCGLFFAIHERKAGTS